jgi:hypothetical protein
MRNRRCMYRSGTLSIITRDELSIYFFLMSPFVFVLEYQESNTLNNAVSAILYTNKEQAGVTWTECNPQV